MVCANGVFSQMKEKSGKMINISSSTAYWARRIFFITLLPKRC